MKTMVWSELCMLLNDGQVSPFRSLQVREFPLCGLKGFTFRQNCGFNLIYGILKLKLSKGLVNIGE